MKSKRSLVRPLNFFVFSTLMPLDYSKWDNFELSDDSDIECHPNVDKLSMIKWKKESIYHERAQRREHIAQLEHKINQLKVMSERMEQLQLTLSQKNSAEAIQKVTEELAQLEITAKTEAGRGWVEPIPGVSQGMPDMSAEHVFKTLKEEIQTKAKMTTPDTAQKIISVLFQGTQRASQQRMDLFANECTKLKKEADKKLTSENMFKETSNRTILNSVSTPPIQPPKSERSLKTPKSDKPKKKIIETLNPESKLNFNYKRHNAGDDEDDQDDYDDEDDQDDYDDEDDEEEDIKLSPLAEKFCALEGFIPSFKFISDHPQIVVDTFADEIMAEAFTAELKSHKKYARNCVFQSLTLQYCGQLGKDGVAMFFSRMFGENPQPKKMFQQDVKTTYERIASRCIELAAEKEAEGPVETIQLQTVDGGAPLTVRIPDEFGVEEAMAYHVFTELPDKFRRALETKDISKINKVLEKMPVKKAEKLIEICSTYGFLDVDKTIVDGTGAEDAGAEGAGLDTE
ncbi:hypothetical protein BDF14DRAFT_1789990 [Spinellus fusiger]|nr:hypothetical protein BDF14DRAFT_1789990 [Spinellus fusiger]